MFVARMHTITNADQQHCKHPLQARLTDSNRNLAAKVLQLLGDIARAMGPPFDRGARPPLLSPAVANLSDNKKQVGLIAATSKNCDEAAVAGLRREGL
jgi:hypothetical protein